MDSGLERLTRQHQASVRVGIVLATRFDGPVQILQVRFSDLEVRDGIINPMASGISSRPLVGAQVVVSVPSGHAPGGIVIASGDQRHTFSLAEGEAAFHDDLGQSFHLTRGGFVITGNLILAGNLIVTGAITATGDITAGAGGDGAVSLLGHEHTSRGTGVPTSAPIAGT